MAPCETSGALEELPMSEPVVTISHVRACALCVRGARDWFKRHDLDFAHFLQHGYPVSVIEATGDHLGLQVAQHARNEAQRKKT